MGTYIPSTAAFFLSYVLFRAFTVLPMELCQIWPLIESLLHSLALAVLPQPHLLPPAPAVPPSKPMRYVEGLKV